MYIAVTGWSVLLLTSYIHRVIRCLHLLNTGTVEPLLYDHPQNHIGLVWSYKRDGRS